MNNLVVCKALFLMHLFVLGFSSTIDGQSLTDSKNTILRYEVFFDGDIYSSLDPRDLRSEKQEDQFLENQELVDEQLYFESFELLKKGLDLKIIELEPLTVLKEFDLEYNIYGFPVPPNSTAVIKQLNKKGYQSEYYLIFQVNVGIESDVFGSGGLSKQFRQKTTIDCTILNPYGRKLRFIEGIEVNDRPTRIKDFPEKKFDKTDQESIEILLEFLSPGLESAVEKLLKDF